MNEATWRFNAEPRFAVVIVIQLIDELKLHWNLQDEQHTQHYQPHHSITVRELRTHFYSIGFNDFDICNAFLIQDRVETIAYYYYYYYNVSQKKHPQHFWLQLENQLSDFDNFWYEYSWHNLPSNDHLVFHLTQHFFLHYLGITQPAKYHFFIQCDMIA